MLPSLASMRDEKDPPARKSTVAAVVCQSLEGEFHCFMSSGVVQASQTCSIGAATFVSSVIFIVFSSYFVEADKTRNPFPVGPRRSQAPCMSFPNCDQAKSDLRRLSRR